MIGLDFCLGLKASFIPQSSIIFVCFLKAFPRKEYVIASFIICLWLKSNISLPVKCSYLLTLHDDNVEFFAAFVILYCNFSS